MAQIQGPLSSHSSSWFMEYLGTTRRYLLEKKVGWNSFGTGSIVKRFQVVGSRVQEGGACVRYIHACTYVGIQIYVPWLLLVFMLMHLCIYSVCIHTCTQTFSGKGNLELSISDEGQHATHARTLSRSEERIPALLGIGAR